MGSSQEVIPSPDIEQRSMRSSEVRMGLNTLQYPITALCFMNLDQRYLLIAEGHTLSIFAVESGTCVSKIDVFASQAIHGLYCERADQLADRKVATRVLLWGGHSTSVVNISVSTENSPEYTVNLLCSELQASDRILDGVFTAWTLNTGNLERSSSVTTLLTAHNE